MWFITIFQTINYSFDDRPGIMKHIKFETNFEKLHKGVLYFEFKTYFNNDGIVI